MIQKKSVSHVVFIDSNVEDYESLISGVSPNAEVIILDETLCGIEQITERLATKQNIEAIHIISHGSPGALQLGANTLNSSNIESFAPGLQQWRKALIPGADILLYGCNVAADVSVTTDIDYIRHISQGLTPVSYSLSRLKATQDNFENSLIGSSVDDFRYQTGVKTPGGFGVKPTKPNQFLERLSELTGADIAASANPTGNAALGGDWELEVQIGRIEATPIQALGYSHILATAKPDNKALRVNSPAIRYRRTCQRHRKCPPISTEYYHPHQRHRHYQRLDLCWWQFHHRQRYLSQPYSPIEWRRQPGYHLQPYYGAHWVQ
jgi:hypothetical protein